MLRFYFGKVSFDKLPSKELTEKYNDFYAINQLLKDGKTFKVAHGIYSDVGPRLVELECLFAQYQMLFCLCKAHMPFMDWLIIFLKSIVCQQTILNKITKSPLAELK